MKNVQTIGKDWLERIKIYKVRKIDSPVLINRDPDDKRKLNLGRKIQNWMIKNSIGVFQGLIEFIESLIARKNSFEFNLGFNWKKLKSES